MIPASSPVYKLLTTKAEDDKEDKHVIVNNANEATTIYVTAKKIREQEEAEEKAKAAKSEPGQE